MGICKFLNLKTEVHEIADLYNRGQRSGTGISIFKEGGFVVDACKKDRLLPRDMFKSKFPKDWRIILLNDIKLKGTSGKRENKSFSKSSHTNHKQSELSNILLRGILPSIVYEDFHGFSKNLTEFQRNTAEFYSEKQKGIFLSPEIDFLIEDLETSNKASDVLKKQEGSYTDLYFNYTINQDLRERRAYGEIHY